MKLREAQYENCTTCHTQLKCVREEVYGCDECRKQIDLHEKGIDYLEIAIFRHDNTTTHMQFCSWKCCLRGLKKVRTDYFVSLPFLHYDNGILAKEFFKLVKI